MTGVQTCALPICSVRTTSPFEQARGYMFDVMKLIQSDGILLHPSGHAYQGKSIVPFGYGAVLINTRKQFAQTNLHEVFPEDRCVFKDEMSESVDGEVFRTRLWKMVPPRIGSPVTLPQFDRLRALLFPEIRIRQIALPLEPKPAAQEDRTLAVMDLHQEQVARGLGEGHRIIRGVAGSGKALILVLRRSDLPKLFDLGYITVTRSGMSGRVRG